MLQGGAAKSVHFGYIAIFNRLYLPGYLPDFAQTDTKYGFPKEELAVRTLLTLTP